MFSGPFALNWERENIPLSDNPFSNLLFAGIYFFYHTNIVLADEINRATPKTQSALLEAMQEKTVTVGKTTYELPMPFMVLATQNPIENEGTYQLRFAKPRHTL